MKYILSIFFIVLSFLCCSDKKERNVKIYADDPSAVVRTAKSSTSLKFAVAPVISPKSSFAYYSRLIKYIQERLGIEIEQVFFRSYIDTNNAIKSNECDIAIICTGSYLMDRESMKILVVPQIRDKTTYNSYIIVNSKININNFDELKNHSFAFTDPLSLTGYLYVKYLLTTKNLKPSDYFNRVVYTSSHDKSIELIVNGLVDGASVDSIVYDMLADSNKDIKDNTRVIDISPDFGMPPVVTKINIDTNIFQN
ncbi:MAG: PhnD/SsuA/transferrin family substrate-binding protein [Myxococcota bacterium]